MNGHLKRIFHVSLIGAISGSSGSSDIATNANTDVLTVNAGLDQTLSEGSSTALSGAISSTASTVAIEWSQVSGPMIEFSATDLLAHELSAPRVREDTEVVLRLSVTTDEGVVSDDMTLTVANTTNGPRGPSPQGIRDDGRADRRNRDRRGRRLVESREVRSYDGSNNNIENPEWGSTLSHLQRLGEADYADGISSLTGELRPSARVIFNAVLNQEEGISLPSTFSRTDMAWQ